MAQSDSESSSSKNRLMYGGKEVKEPNDAKLIFQVAFKDLAKVFTIKENNSKILLTLLSHQMIEKADFSRLNEYKNLTEWNVNFFELLYNKSDLPDILKKLVNLNDPDLSDYQKHINKTFTLISTLKEKVSITEEVEEAVENVQLMENEHSRLVENQQPCDTSNVPDNICKHPTHPDQDSQQRSCPTIFNLSLFLTIVNSTPVFVIGALVIIYFIVVSSCTCFEKESCSKSSYFSSDEQLAIDNDKIVESRSMPSNDLGLPYNILVNSTIELTQQQLQICSSLFVNLTINFTDPTHWHGFQLSCTTKIKILIFKGFFSLRNVEELLSQIPKELFGVQIYCDKVCVANECAAVQNDNSRTVVLKSFGILTLWASEEGSDCNTVLEFLGKDSRFSFSKFQSIGIPITVLNLPFINQILKTHV